MFIFCNKNSKKPTKVLRFSQMKCIIIIRKFQCEGKNMLINFKVKNFRSFKNEIVLSMEATKDKEYVDFNTFEINKELMPQSNNVLVKSAVIYGANASGKSNVLKGLRYMKQVVEFSGTLLFGIIDRNEPFIFSNDNTIPSFFEVEIIENEVYYKYNFSILNGKIVGENLYRRKERLTSVFERNDKISIPGVDIKTINLFNLNDKKLFLTMAASDINFPGTIKTSLKDVFHWFQKLMPIFEEDINMFKIYENEKYLHEALNILKLADIGISDFSIYQEKITPIEDVFNRRNIKTPKNTQLYNNKGEFSSLDIKTDFDVYNDKNKKDSTKEIYLLKDAGFHSDGTKRLIFYLGWILAALDEGRVLLLDEIDSKLHFLIADYILKKFNSIGYNCKNAQLIATAHNLMLMDGEIRRDQIYFTSKDKYGVSSLVCLSDFRNVRKNDLFSKKYLLGFYSEIPNLSEDF